MLLLDTDCRLLVQRSYIFPILDGLTEPSVSKAIPTIRDRSDQQAQQVNERGCSCSWPVLPSTKTKSQDFFASIVGKFSPVRQLTQHFLLLKGLLAIGKPADPKE